MRVIVLVGARPNFVKAAPLLPALGRWGIEASVAHTGQHYDQQMSDVFFRDLELSMPRWFLGVGSGTHAVQTAAAMVKIEALLDAEHPDALIVVGDVNSTLAGALAAVKVCVPVVHLEAGLRSKDLSMPEEVNRLVTDQLSAMLLTPVREADANLRAEGIDPERIHFVGNIMAESLLRNQERVQCRDVASGFGLSRGSYVLATIHRPENTDHPERLREIARALLEAPFSVLLPAHPRTKPLLEAFGVGMDGSSVRVVEPVGYLDMIALERDAAVVVTDSGGVQEEACVLHTPCVTVRRNTERGITVKVGANRLVQADSGALSAAIVSALESGRDWVIPEYWDDQVSDRVARALLSGIVPLAGM